MDEMTQEDAMNMNDEQAIKILIPLKNMMRDQHGCPISDAYFALDKAIEALQHSEPQWIPCSERLPERIINDDVETEQEFFVTIKERWPGEEWTYHTDLAWVPGEYIDDFWQTYNDWKEGQEVQVIAWMPLPEPYNPT